MYKCNKANLLSVHLYYAATGGNKEKLIGEDNFLFRFVFAYAKTTLNS